ncbi:hypothetical protein LJ655_00130 [Paraburkholderia sp. MMS20-SJTN17]|uniref:Uncharacterized protein n=1 Tax=Paraburkholderia translucens TaxID=2886945 RepID=A0ABS8K6H4_9BURK|nr:hypothetical protein [Paraburkholderia sp. MMS20-SJTN17]
MTVGQRVDLPIQTRSLPFPPCESFFDKSAWLVRAGLHNQAVFLRRSGAPQAWWRRYGAARAAFHQSIAPAIAGFVRSIKGFGLMAR